MQLGGDIEGTKQINSVSLILLVYLVECICLLRRWLAVAWCSREVYCRVGRRGMEEKHKAW